MRVNCCVVRSLRFVKPVSCLLYFFFIRCHEFLLSQQGGFNGVAVESFQLQGHLHPRFLVLRSELLECPLRLIFFFCFRTSSLHGRLFLSQETVCLCIFCLAFGVRLAVPDHRLVFHCRTRLPQRVPDASVVLSPPHVFEKVVKDRSHAPPDFWDPTLHRCPGPFNMVRTGSCHFVLEFLRMVHSVMLGHETLLLHVVVPRPAVTYQVTVLVDVGFDNRFQSLCGSILYCDEEKFPFLGLFNCPYDPNPVRGFSSVELYVTGKGLIYVDLDSSSVSVEAPNPQTRSHPSLLYRHLCDGLSKVFLPICGSFRVVVQVCLRDG
mmetsp:Transcript_7766/g.15104  ORF Transcript_7766/g.15104 Transcript_7766/m.15104 type:complete len:321 (+) Transcript_7766:182-1144(+)